MKTQIALEQSVGKTIAAQLDGFLAIYITFTDDTFLCLQLTDSESPCIHDSPLVPSEMNDYGMGSDLVTSGVLTQEEYAANCAARLRKRAADAERLDREHYEALKRRFECA